MNLILDFISKFNSVADKFTNGWCYYFSVILCDRFYQDNPEIYYDPIANHFVTRINDVYYDANGIYYDYTILYKWDEYHMIDALDAARVRRDCIVWRRDV